MMTTLDLSRARPHDLGGQKAGPIDRGEHALEGWHRLVTAILGVLRDDSHHLLCVDEMRRAMEDMPPEDYRRLEYFERWAVGLSTLMVEKGLMTRAEIDRRLAGLGAKR
jgi:Nitrile hydratase beta subunit, N-terminal